MTLVLVTAFFFAWYLKTKGSDVAFQEGPCGFSQTLHLYCPGCGGTRAVKYLLQFDPIRSFLANPIPLYTAILLLRIWVAFLHNVVCCRELHRSTADVQKQENGDMMTGSSRRWKLLYQWEMWGILVVVIGFFIIRNLALVLFKWDFLGDMAGYW
ncbi:MAG: DUF2752 domain-containing protein [Clostridiales bacterium]|nr:DUF2752 domain-containing protein [Clostridiales bacterium]